MLVMVLLFEARQMYAMAAFEVLPHPNTAFELLRWRRKGECALSPVWVAKRFLGKQSADRLAMIQRAEGGQLWLRYMYLVVRLCTMIPGHSSRPVCWDSC